MDFQTYVQNKPNFFAITHKWSITVIIKNTAGCSLLGSHSLQFQNECSAVYDARLFNCGNINTGKIESQKGEIVLKLIPSSRLLWTHWCQILISLVFQQNQIRLKIHRTGIITVLGTFHSNSLASDNYWISIPHFLCEVLLCLSYAYSFNPKFPEQRVNHPSTLLFPGRWHVFVAARSNLETEEMQQNNWPALYSEASLNDSHLESLFPRFCLQRFCFSGTGMGSNSSLVMLILTVHEPWPWRTANWLSILDLKGYESNEPQSWRE